MSESKNVAKAALAGVISLALLGATSEAVIAAPVDAKCYGIAGANKNDCATVVSACAATIAQPKACYAWIFTPKGMCEKIDGASVNKPAANCVGPNGKPVS